RSASACETLMAVKPMSRFGAGVSHPIFNGPFGTVTSFNGVDCQGFFTATAGSTVLARDTSGVPKNVMLYRNHGLGRVILLGDVDFVAGALSAGNAITTANDRLLGNLFAFATAAGACVPSATVLCVDNAPGDRRFRVEISFQTVQAGGVSGFGQAIQL